MKKYPCVECNGTGEEWDRTNEEENGASITECEHCGGTGDEPEVPKNKARGKR